jgi:DNA-binding beta-propeller fold protein YncE
LQFYVVGQANDTVFEYSCSTAWDITTASYASKSFSIASQEISPTGIFFKPNGLKMYVVGSNTDNIYEYDLGTAWDVSTSVYNSVSFSVAGQDTSPQELFFTNDGYKMFVIGSTGDDINEYALSKPWDITTAQFLGVFSVSSQDATPTGLYIKPDLSKFYITGSTNDTVYQYSMGAGSINLTSDVIVNGKFNIIGTPPVAATSTGKQGDIIWDSAYIYICVADNTWKRSAISTW